MVRSARFFLLSIVACTFVMPEAFGYAVPRFESINVPKYAAIGRVTPLWLDVIPNVPSWPDDITLTYPIPAGLTFYSLTRETPGFTCTTPPAGQGGSIVCTMPHLTAPATLMVVFSVSADLAPGTIITHTATTSGGAPPPDPSYLTTTASQTAATAPQVTITSGFPKSVVAGAPVSYDVTIANTGTTPVTVLTFERFYGAPATSTSGSQVSGPPFRCYADSCGSLQPFAPGDSATFRFTMMAFPDAAGTIRHVSSLNYTVFNIGDYVEDSATVSSVADLSVAASAPPSVAIGADIPISITLGNAGPSQPHAASLTMTTPAGTVFTSVTAAPLTCTTPAAGSSGTISCTGSLKPGAQSMTVHLRATATGMATAAITFASSDATDPNPSNNSASVATTVTPAAADLALTMSGTPSAIVKFQHVTYTMTVTNNGPSTATNARVTDPLPADAAGTGVDSRCAGTPIVCNAGDLAAGASATFVNTVELLDAGTTINTATASSDVTDSNPSNNSATVQTAVMPPTSDLRLSVTPSRTTAAPGDDIRYAFTLTNSGPDAALDTAVAIALPADIRRTAVPTGCTDDRNLIRCQIGVILSGASSSGEIGLAAPSATGPLPISFAGNTSSYDPDATNDRVTVTVMVGAGTVSGDADVTISATSAPAVANDATFALESVIANRGPAAATNVTLTITAPPFTAILASDPPDGFTCTNTVVKLTCTATTLAAGATVRSSVQMSVHAPSSGVTLKATATIAAANHDPDPTNNSAETNVVIGTLPHHRATRH